MAKNENCNTSEIYEIPAITWQNMKEYILFLIDNDLSSEKKKEIGDKLIKQISSYENKNILNHVKNEDNFTMKENNVIEELRNIIYNSIKKISSITENLACMDEKHNILKNNILVLEEKLEIMQNVNCNFRKILKLENEFLGELLKSDKATISQLHKKLHVLRINLDDICDRSGLDQTSSLSIINDPQLNNDSLEFYMQNTGNITSRAQNLTIQTVNPIIIGLSELMSNGFTKNDILQLLQNKNKSDINL